MWHHKAAFKSYTFAKKLLGTKKNQSILSGVMQRLFLTAIHKSIFAVVLAGAAALCPMSNAATVLRSSAIMSQLLTVTASSDELSIASLVLRYSAYNIVTSMAATDSASATAWLDNLAVNDERENVAAGYVWSSQGMDSASLRFAIENTPALIGIGGRRGMPVDAISYQSFTSNPIPEPSSVMLAVTSAFATLRRRR